MVFVCDYTNKLNVSVSFSADLTIVLRIPSLKSFVLIGFSSAEASKNMANHSSTPMQPLRTDIFVFKALVFHRVNLCETHFISFSVLIRLHPATLIYDKPSSPIIV